MCGAAGREPNPGNRELGANSGRPEPGNGSRWEPSPCSREPGAKNQGPGANARGPEAENPGGGEPEPKAGDVALLVSDIVTINQCLRP